MSFAASGSPKMDDPPNYVAQAASLQPCYQAVDKTWKIDIDVRHRRRARINTLSQKFPFRLPMSFVVLPKTEIPRLECSDLRFVVRSNYHPCART